jgi:hypothetical protein
MSPSSHRRHYSTILPAIGGLKHDLPSIVPNTVILSEPFSTYACQFLIIASIEPYATDFWPLALAPL